MFNPLYVTLPKEGRQARDISRQPPKKFNQTSISQNHLLWSKSQISNLKSQID
ncbi:MULTISPECIES: hypothetical protein [unclassified Microcoleus]|uniref:hypothetical protein n=1 Tax=unclassified Microcoleus TaxID=2642155 RepID=UPI002FD40B03